MAELNGIDQVCTAMVAVASDGKRLGQVTQIYAREGETYLEVRPRGKLWNPWHLLGGVKRIYLPGTTVGEVTTTPAWRLLYQVRL